MMFEPLSEYIRKEKSLPDNWRVYAVEALDDGRIKCTGALTRPVDKENEPHLPREYDWIKPMMGRKSVIISRETYDRAYEATR